MNARYPNRSRASDGSIGDAAHAATGSDSDHNPWVGPGVVTALDITHDPANGIDIDRFSDELAASRDPRIKYLIANALILDSRPQFHPWQWMVYAGSNPHTKHLHVSVMADAGLYDDARAWNLPSLGGAPTAPKPGPVGGVPAFPLPPGHYFGLITGPAESHGGYYAAERPHVQLIQRALIRKGFVTGVSDPASDWADGKFERPTYDAVTRFQRAHMPGTTRFGEVWADDWVTLVA
ncbi:peptidoglycan-binding domain-containing protein [Actinosynnema sp. NPDC020468]|uniref:peptidoglycan-binding domain-containing protein n=1 Tax=Actinosynnema sp. NPDC020468 TaxID=3154488 RepID=UPI00340F061B